MRKARAFRGGANKTAPPCFPEAVSNNLATVPVEQLQRERLTEKSVLRENGLQCPAKGGSTPCFCLPACCNCPVALFEFTILILKIQLCLNWTVSKDAIAAGKTCCKYNLLRKCGLLAHTSPTFLKNCWIKKLFIWCIVLKEMIIICFPDSL